MTTGSVYLSKAPGYVLCIKEPVFNYNVPQGHSPDKIRNELVADFMEGGALGSGQHPEADVGVSAVWGGVFDLDETAERLGWTSEEKEFAKVKLDRIADDPRQPDVTRFSAPVPTAPLPNWDGLSAPRKLAMASELGIVAEALAYEQSVAADDELVAALQKKHAAVQADAAADLELTAA